MTPITFTIPVRAVSEANAHQHWRARQKRAKAQREAARFIAGAELQIAVPRRSVFAYGPTCFSITLTRIAPRKLDSDNLAGSMKHVRDGIADALGVDDGDERIEWRVEQRKGRPGEYAVGVEIRERTTIADAYSTAALAAAIAKIAQAGGKPDYAIIDGVCYGPDGRACEVPEWMCRNESRAQRGEALMGIVKFVHHEGEASLSRGPALRVRTLCGCERLLKEEPGGRELVIPMQSANGALYGERRFRRELDSDGKCFWLEVNQTLPTMLPGLPGYSGKVTL